MIVPSFTVAYDELNECWEVTVSTPPAPQWTLSLTGDEAEKWTDADAVIGARKTLIDYALRRDQPGLMPEWREAFRALPEPVELARCAFGFEPREKAL